MRTEQEIRARLKEAEGKVEEEAACYDPTSLALVEAETTVVMLHWVLGE